MCYWKVICIALTCVKSYRSNIYKFTINWTGHMYCMNLCTLQEAAAMYINSYTVLNSPWLNDDTEEAREAMLEQGTWADSEMVGDNKVLFRWHASQQVQMSNDSNLLYVVPYPSPFGGYEGHGGEMGACVSKRLWPQLPTTNPHTRCPLWKLSAWLTTECSPVYASPISMNKKENGQMVKDTDAGDGVSIKTQRGRQRVATSLLFPS